MKVRTSSAKASSCGENWNSMIISYRRSACGVEVANSRLMPIAVTECGRYGGQTLEIMIDRQLTGYAHGAVQLYGFLTDLACGPGDLDLCQRKRSLAIFRGGLAHHERSVQGNGTCFFQSNEHVDHAMLQCLV